MDSSLVFDTIAGGSFPPFVFYTWKQVELPCWDASKEWLPCSPTVFQSRKLDVIISNSVYKELYSVILPELELLILVCSLFFSRSFVCLESS